jgi:purine-binding chemotaxis protein CheW
MDGQASGSEQALVKAEEATHESFDLLVAFELAGQEYGMMASVVREIIRKRATTRVPNVAGYIQGVINLRGRIIPVFNLRRRLNLPEAEGDERANNAVMVIECDGNDAGLLVDKVTSVLKVDDKQIDRTVTRMDTSIGKKFIDGTVDVNGKLITLLKAEPMLESENSKKEKVQGSEN